VHEVGVPPHENDAYVARVRELGPQWQDALSAEIAAIRARGRQA
jgi:hypothetical protein